MSELEPEQEIPAWRSALRRFRSDVRYARSYFDMRNGFSKYVAAQFDLPDDAAWALYDACSEELPAQELFDRDEDLAREALRLGLLRVVLPLVEQTTESDQDYVDWLRYAVPVALDATHGAHDITSCSGDTSDTALQCAVSPNCPVKVTRALLIKDVVEPDFSSYDYRIDFLHRTKRRALIKLSVAKDSKLLQPLEAETYRRQYEKHCKQLVFDNVQPPQPDDK